MSMVESDKNRNGRFLKEFSGPCPVCDYYLNEPTSPRCPECGSKLVAGLISPFHFYPWHALLVGISISFGVCFDRLFLIMLGFVNSNATRPPWVYLGISVFLFIVLCIGFVVVWKYKTHLEKIPSPKRYVWYGFSLFIPIAIVVVQYFLIMAIIRGVL